MSNLNETLEALIPPNSAAAQKQRKLDERRARQEAAGIPDTPLNINEQQLPTGESRMLLCHINGVAIADLNLGPEVIAALDYFATDEGIQERNDRPMARPPSGISLGSDPFTKALQEKRDDVIDRGYDSYEARDPFREIAKRHAVPGMRAKMLSAQKVKDGGNVDYEVVKDTNGDPVKCKGMILGHIPERVAEARNKHYRKSGNERLSMISQKYVEEGGATAVSDQ